ncbi:MAG TPA: ferredoxin reductase [Anaerolineales bacterium]|nr:ferredoxin reductase [Anaerolineales bacterium]HLO30514.1 ferredoxin reductase [Anaerolineales bacterium]
MKQTLEWQIASIKDIKPETAKVKSFTLMLPRWMRHRAGQHYDIRLTAEDGYQAQRSYSIASEPEREDEVDLTVERIDDGEVSAYMHDVLIPGDRIEARGPIGGYFVWEATMDEPLLLIAGGSGVVPLMSMLRHRAAAGAKNPASLLYSSRSFDDIIYYNELEKLQAADNGPQVFHTLTRSQPPGWKGYSRRIDPEMLKEVVQPLGKSVQTFICGPTLLVESVANALVKIGMKSDQIRTERFGPTGG